MNTIMKQKIRINESQLRKMVAESVKMVLKEGRLDKAEGWYRARVVQKLIDGWKHSGQWEEVMKYYNQGIYEFLSFISPMLSDADFLTPEEQSPEYDLKRGWDFSKQDREREERELNYIPYDDEY